MTADSLAVATQNDLDPIERKREREEKKRYILDQANMFREIVPK